jgi:uncharacterized surface protein with fasciclin (FAS1) repeats
VFAPVNAAFECLPAGTVDMLLKPGNKAQLTKVLTCHVVAADAMSSAIAGIIKDDGGTHPVKTVGGCCPRCRRQETSPEVPPFRGGWPAMAGGPSKKVAMQSRAG